MNLEERIAAAGIYDAWLCDLDGTLAETMPLHHRAYASVFADLGGALSLEDFSTLAGGPARETISRFAAAAGVSADDALPWEQIHARKKALFSSFVAAGEIAPLELAALVRAAPPHVRVAVVTSGNRAGAIEIVEALGLTGRIDLIVSGDDVEKGKPDPEPYRKAAELLAIAPEDCLVFEDHADGVASARAAGMTVIDVSDLVRA
jgi:HAD superfamily hydrolase (TIGR01509 family)